MVYFTNWKFGFDSDDLKLLILVLELFHFVF